MNAADYDVLVDHSAKVLRRIRETTEQLALEQGNRERAILDRIGRGLSPWGAKSSRYAPEEEVEEP